MDWYDQELDAMQAELDRLSRLVLVLPESSPELADVQDQGLLLYREREEVRATVAQRRRLDGAIAGQERRIRDQRAAAAQRSGNWSTGAMLTLLTGVLAVLVSLPVQSWQLRAVGLVLGVLGVLCLLRMSALQRRASDGAREDHAALAVLHDQYRQLDSQPTMTPDPTLDRSSGSGTSGASAWFGPPRP